MLSPMLCWCCAMLQVAETDKALRQEREISQQARAETANLRSELMAVQEAMMSNLIS